MKLKLEDYSKEGFPLALAMRQGNASFPLHTHDFLELVIVFGGHGSHMAENETYRIETGDVFVVTGNIRHGYKNAGTLNILNIMFDFKELDLPLHDLRRLPGFNTLFEIEPKLREEHDFKSRLTLNRENLTHARRLALALENEMDQRAQGYRALSIALLTELLVFLSRCVSATPSPEYQTVRLFGKIISFIENNHASDITLDLLAERANMSKRNFQRSFKKTMGISPIHYLLNLRIDKAREMLKNTDKPVSQIAHETGFADSNYFSRQFKKITGSQANAFR